MSSLRGILSESRGEAEKFEPFEMENYYYAVLGFSLLAIYLFCRILHPPMGLTLQGIRDSETRSAWVGIFGEMAASTR